MNCPLCDSILVESFTASSDNLSTLRFAECPTKVSAGLSHYYNDDWGVEAIVMPYIIRCHPGNKNWTVIELNEDGVGIKYADLPLFEIPPQDQFVAKIKLLLLFS